MNSIVDQYDKHGNIVYLLDYDECGIYFVARGHENSYEVIRKSESLDGLIEYVSELNGDPQVIISDVCEILWSLEISDGREWWSDFLDDQCDIEAK